MDNLRADALTAWIAAGVLAVLAAFGSPYAVGGLVAIVGIGLWRNVWAGPPRIPDADMAKLVAQINAVTERTTRLSDEVQKLSVASILPVSGFGDK